MQDRQPDPVVRVEADGAVLTMTLARPAARNAVDPQLARELDEALDAFEADPGLHVGILAAEGPAFCAGADLACVARGDEGFVVPATGFAGLAERARSKPLIAAVDGPAVAGGCEIVLACDLVVASKRAAFGLPEVRRSLIAAAGGAARLPWALPRNVALELLLTGEPLDAERAHRLGFVNVLCEPGGAVAAAHVLARRICAGAPLAVRATRAVALTSLAQGEAAGWRDSARALEELRGTEDFAEGPRAFVEKRAPRWRGR